MLDNKRTGGPHQLNLGDCSKTRIDFCRCSIIDVTTTLSKQWKAVNVGIGLPQSKAIYINLWLDDFLTASSTSACA